MTTEKTLDLGVDAIHSCVYRTSYRDLQQLISIYRFVISAFTICECMVVVRHTLNANCNQFIRASSISTFDT